MERAQSLVGGAGQIPAAEAGDTTGAARRRPYSREVSAVLAAAFILSAFYTVVTTVVGVTDDALNPAGYVLYAVGAACVVLVRTDRRRAWWTVAAILLGFIAVGIFVYPSLFVPSRQTTFGWFENDVYMGLLIVAEYLCIQRLRGVALEPGT